MKQQLNCIMLVDDDEMTNFIHRMVLERSNYCKHIQIAESGIEALEYLKKCEPESTCELYPSPELIFLDINMPAMNGWEFLEEYKRLKLKKRVIVVMLSTSLFKEDRLKAEAIEEISCFENKALTPEKLENIIKKYFSDSILADESYVISEITGN